MERTYILVTEEWEAYAHHGYVTALSDVDTQALWRRFREEFAICGPFPFAPAALKEAGCTADPPEAFVSSRGSCKHGDSGLWMWNSSPCHWSLPHRIQRLI